MRKLEPVACGGVVVGIDVRLLVWDLDSTEELGEMDALAVGTNADVRMIPDAIDVIWLEIFCRWLKV